MCPGNPNLRPCMLFCLTFDCFLSKNLGIFSNFCDLLGGPIALHWSTHFAFSPNVQFMKTKVTRLILARLASNMQQLLGLSQEKKRFSCLLTLQIWYYVIRLIKCILHHVIITSAFHRNFSHLIGLHIKNKCFSQLNSKLAHIRVRTAHLYEVCPSPCPRPLGSYLSLT